MEFNALVITQEMTPFSILKWHESVSAVLSKKVILLESYEETVSSPSITLQIPAVVMLKRHVSRSKDGVPFSRSNVYLRDQWTCQYCYNKFEARQLTYDHVVPRHQGGKTTWQNIASCCRRCNSKKRNRTPEQAGMKLLRQPVRPKSLPLSGLVVLPRDVPEQWLPYLEGSFLLSHVS